MPILQSSGQVVAFLCQHLGYPSLGRQLRRPDLPAVGARWCEAALPERSVYRFLVRERARLFPPELFADLFRTVRGHPSASTSRR